ncbi:MAG: PKD domain-containing protein [Gammaproteobacteria bacterium]|nr:PKD domain-containing protein [Gammaproteobacteria bacterium]
MDIRIRLLFSFPLWLAVLLPACESSPPNRPPTARFAVSPSSGPPPLSVTLDASASRDVDGSIARYEWDFGNGAIGTGRTVEHVYSESGAFTVRLTVTDDDGVVGEASKELVVNRVPTARIVADPVDGKAPVTVTFDATASADEDGEIVSYAWEVDGAAPASGATVEHTFTDPGVYAVGLTVRDDLGGAAEAVFEVNARDDADVAFTVPYVPDATYAEELRPCVYPDSTSTGGCTLDRLPFIGMEHSVPTVDDVMSRVLVSHRWMGDSFREVLMQLPEDVRLLARSVTAIVIASDVIPAYYNPTSGAIYLEAEFFWRTLEERAVITLEPDFRGAFGATLQLRVPWRSVHNNTTLRLWVPPGETRPELPLDFAAFVLYHELSHAADFVRASRLDGYVDGGQTVWEMAVADYWGWPSTQLRLSHPLRSAVMRGLAGVVFLGDAPTPEQESLQPDDVVDEFAEDGAVDFYSYSTPYEDLADMHDSLLMSYHQGYEKDVGIVGTEAESVWDSIVAWGQRGRMTDPAVIDRARRVIDLIYPGDAQAMHGYLAARPAPLPMRRGETWAENLVLEGGADFNAPAHSKGPLKPLAGTRAERPFLAWASRNGLTDIRQRDDKRHPSADGRQGGSGRLVGCILWPDGVPVELRERVGIP